jgi:phosphatidylserine decarboxylase
MTPYARTEVTAIAIVGGGLAIVVAIGLGWWGLVPAVLAGAVLSFYRDPSRRPPAGDHLILAPADGKIVGIEPDATDAEGRRVLRIRIFLSVFNVHINRSPCAGRVIDVAYRAGQFLNALNDAADERNECNTITIEPATPLPGPIGVRQIAGVLARRIVCAVSEGESLRAGQRVGMIKLGSRTEITLPADGRWRIDVRVGQRVRAGLTVLARYEVAGGNDCPVAPLAGA